MKRKIHSILILTVMFLITLTSFSVYADTASKNSKKKMTVMVYMIGSDLESSTGAATNDLNEMAASGIDTDQVNLLIYAGGTKKWRNDFSKDENAIYSYNGTDFEKVQTYEKSSMGEADTLTQFLNYVPENYESDSYALILWDHGNGPVMGYGLDKQYDGDSLLLTEIDSALSQSVFQRDNKLAFIGFDACLMASAELVCVADEYADYLVSSQEVEPNFGWNYEFLRYCASIELEELVKSIVSCYSDRCEEYIKENSTQNIDYTMSAVDLSYGEKLQEAVNKLFEKASTYVKQDYPELAIERIHAKALGRASTGSEYDLVDLKNLSEQMTDICTNECKDLKILIGKMVIANQTNIANCSGFSIYYPYFNKEYYSNTWKETYKQLDIFPSYLNYLESYEENWLANDMQEYFQDNLIPKIDFKGNYTLQLSEEQNQLYASAGYYILEQESDSLYRMVFNSGNVSNKDGKLTAGFDGNVLYFQSDEQKTLALNKEIDSTNGVTTFEYFPFVQNDYDDSQSTHLFVTVDENTGETSIKGFYYDDDSEDDSITSGKQEDVDTSDWKTLQIYNAAIRYLTRDDDGHIADYYEWPSNDWITWNEYYLADGFSFSYEPLYDNGHQYYVMFRVDDVQDNSYYSELLPIELETAPKESDTEPDRKVTLNTETQRALLEENDQIRSELLITRNPATNTVEYFIETENKTDHKIQYTINNLFIDEDIQSDGSYESVDPDTTVQCRLSGLEKSLIRAELLNPHSLSFHLVYRDDTTGKKLNSKQDFEVTIPNNYVSGPMWITMMDARAEEQELVNEKNVTVSLLNAGYYMGESSDGAESENADFSFLFKITNQSKEEVSVTVDSIQINESVNMSAGAGTVETAAGTEAIQEVKIDRGDMEERGVISISDIQVHLLINNKECTIPIVLKEKGTGEMEKPDGDLIYEDENLMIYRDKYYVYTSYFDEQRPAWKMWFVNKSDQTFQVELEDCKVNGVKSDAAKFDDLGSAVQISADSTIKTQIYLDEEPDGQTLTARLTWKPYLSFNDNVIEWSTDEITWEAEE